MDDYQDGCSEQRDSSKFYCCCLGRLWEHRVWKSGSCWVDTECSLIDTCFGEKINKVISSIVLYIDKEREEEEDIYIYI